MKNNKKVGIRNRFIFVLIGLVGQFAWSIENMYINTYITHLNFTDVSGNGFNYSLLIAITTALSAIVATVTTLFMGSLTDRINKRKIFITIGYIIWGIATASFGFLNVNNANSLLPISMSAFTAAIMVIVIDCIMTFFGSTSNDAAFNSYVTKNTTNDNRGKVEGVLSILPLIAMLIIFVGLNGLTTKENGYRWDLFFYIVGALVLIVGVASIFLIPKEVSDEERINEGYLRLLIDGFKPSTIKNNKTLYLLLICYFIYGVAIQVYFPYLMVYVEKTCSIVNSGEGFLTPFAIVMAISLLFGSLGSVVIGNLADKFSKKTMMIPTIFILIIGLLMMYFAPHINNDIARIIYTALSSFVMILGYVAVPTILNSMVRENIPKGKEGTFMGVRMIFVVALPMCIGPFIGDALNQSYGKTYISEYGVESFIPSEYGYLVALAILFVSFIPMYFLFKEIKNKRMHKNNGYLYSNLKKIDEEELKFNLAEHPRPQFNRDNYLVLNGTWDFKISKSESIPETFDNEIVVPFACESPVSKVNHLVEINEFLYYRKYVKIPKTMQNECIFLNFEGVDQSVEVYIDRVFVEKHIGGYTRFKFDIKPFITSDEFEIILKIRDVSDDSYHMKGKQRLNPSGWFYSSSSGVYKPIYIESTPKEYIEHIEYGYHYDEKAISIRAKTTTDEMIKVIISGQTYEIKSNKIEKIVLDPFIPWDVDNPHLYNVKVLYKDDIVNSYFGIRKIEIRKEPFPSIYLNNKRIFLNGLLDQGYYYLGGLTPRNYKEYELDIIRTKELGFNCLRKHIKVENDYYYYYADKHGLLIIQDFPNGGERMKFFYEVFPRISIKLFNKEKYLSYKCFGRKNENGRNEFVSETKQIIDATKNFPSVIIYTIFNEGWGEFDPSKLYKELKTYSSTQLYDSASGWIDTINSDFYSIHSYTFPSKRRFDKQNKRPYILSEIGGASLRIKGHYDYDKLYGHHICLSKKALNNRYKRLYKRLLKRIKDNELNGIIYTELNDCETEANGLYTLDRCVLKFDSNMIKSINKDISNHINKTNIENKEDE